MTAPPIPLLRLDQRYKVDDAPIRVAGGLLYHARLQEFRKHSLPHAGVVPGRWVAVAVVEKGKNRQQLVDKWEVGIVEQQTQVGKGWTTAMKGVCVALCKRNRGGYTYYAVTTYFAGEMADGTPVWLRGEEITGATTIRKGARLAREYAESLGVVYRPDVRHRTVREPGE